MGPKEREDRAAANPPPRPVGVKAIRHARSDQLFGGQPNPSSAVTVWRSKRWAPPGRVVACDGAPHGLRLASWRVDLKLCERPWGLSGIGAFSLFLPFLATTPIPLWSLRAGRPVSVISEQSSGPLAFETPARSPVCEVEPVATTTVASPGTPPCSPPCLGRQVGLIAPATPTVSAVPPGSYSRFQPQHCKGPWELLVLRAARHANRPRCGHVDTVVLRLNVLQLR